MLVRAGLIVLPIVSTIGHAAGALWVYENAFEPAMMCPVLLGIAAVLLRQQAALGGGRPAAHAATLFVACAVATSLMPSDALMYASEQHTWVAFSPLRGVLSVSTVLLGWAWWIGGRGPGMFANACLPTTAASLGHTPSTMLIHLRWLVDAMHALVLELMPTTKLQWGITAITAAFTLLLAGGLLSWWRDQRDQQSLAEQES